MPEFRNDDVAYFQWLEQHPAGLVVNVRRAPDPQYVVLHRASCGTVCSPKIRDGGCTARGYRKIGCLSWDDAVAAARREGLADGSFSELCGRYRPDPMAN